MLTWAAADLAAAAVTPGIAWLVVMLHHPPYTNGSHDSDAESDLVRATCVLAVGSVPAIDPMVL